MSANDDRRARLKALSAAILDRAQDYADYCEDHEKEYGYTAGDLYEAAATLDALACAVPPDGETFAVEAVPGHPAILRVVGVAPDKYATLEQVGAMLAQLEEPSDEDPDRDAWHAFMEQQKTD